MKPLMLCGLTFLCLAILPVTLHAQRLAVRFNGFDNTKADVAFEAKLNPVYPLEPHVLTITGAPGEQFALELEMMIYDIDFNSSVTLDSKWSPGTFCAMEYADAMGNLPQNNIKVYDSFTSGYSPGNEWETHQTSSSSKYLIKGDLNVTNESILEFTIDDAFNCVSDMNWQPLASTTYVKIKIERDGVTSTGSTSSNTAAGSTYIPYYTHGFEAGFDECDLNVTGPTSVSCPTAPVAIGEELNAYFSLLTAYEIQNIKDYYIYDFAVSDNLGLYFGKNSLSFFVAPKNTTSAYTGSIYVSSGLSRNYQAYDYSGDNNIPCNHQIDILYLDVDCGIGGSIQAAVADLDMSLVKSADMKIHSSYTSTDLAGMVELNITEAYTTFSNKVIFDWFVEDNDGDVTFVASNVSSIIPTVIGKYFVRYKPRYVVEYDETLSKYVSATPGDFYIGHLNEMVVYDTEDEVPTLFDLTVSPNPTSNDITIDFTYEGQFEEANYEIYEAYSGNLQHNDEFSSVDDLENLDVSSILGSGYYIVVIKFDGHVMGSTMFIML